MPRTALEKLIKSLTRGELKAYSLFIKNKKDTVHFKLFNLIKNNNLIKHKSNIHNRKYLYNNILESISKTLNSIDAQILKKLLYTEVLFNKQLIKEAWKEINKAQKLARF